MLLIRATLNVHSESFNLIGLKNAGSISRVGWPFISTLERVLVSLTASCLLVSPWGKRTFANTSFRDCSDLLVHLNTIAHVRLYALALFFVLLLFFRDSSLPGLIGGFSSKNAFCFFLGNFLNLGSSAAFALQELVAFRPPWP